MSYLCSAKCKERDVAQLVAHTSGGREVASSSLVIPTFERAESLTTSSRLFPFYIRSAESSRPSLDVLATDVAQWWLPICDALHYLPISTIVDMLFHSDAVFRQPLNLIRNIAHLEGFLSIICYLTHCSAAPTHCHTVLRRKYIEGIEVLALWILFK